MNLRGLSRMCEMRHALCLFLTFVLSLAQGQDLPKLELPGVREQHLLIPMRDGVKLSAYLYLPEGEGKWPVVFEQRYAPLTGTGTRKSSADLARRGYVVAMVNFRGSQQSEGRYVGYRALGWGEHKDGYDICEWLAFQPWSTGKVGTFGSSQGGFVQNFLAVTQPPHLTCQYMVDTGTSLFHEGYRIGGVTRPLRYEAFVGNARNPKDNMALLREWDQHPNDDDYWAAENTRPHFAKMNVPCFTIGSWYDFMVQGSILSFQGRKPHAHQQLLLGPWLHGRLNKGHKVGDLIYPENATWPELDHMVRWFDHWLKGADNGIEKEAAVRYYVMGAVGEIGADGNVWREAKDWPPVATETAFYLHEDAILRATEPTSQSSGTNYESDPLKPMEIPGRAFPGAKDARAFEGQKDVRTWTTEPLAEPMEVTGGVTADIWVKTNVTDTDFILRISDVYPDGRSILLMDYPLRARYREGFDKQVFITPGQPTRLQWHIGHTSIIFNKGHRVRVVLSSTGAPLYEPNNQTGGDQTSDWLKETKTAVHTILHDKEHPSRVILPAVKVVR